jgi:hypothetical protein
MTKKRKNKKIIFNNIKTKFWEKFEKKENLKEKKYFEIFY